MTIVIVSPRTGKRDLTIKFTVTSAPGCPCAESSHTVTIVQKLKINLDVPDTTYESFTATYSSTP